MAVEHGSAPMPMLPRPVAALAATVALTLSVHARGAQSAADVASQARSECDKGRGATARDTRKQHFERGEALAVQAVGLDDGNAGAHFAVACNLGELLRLDGEKVTSVLGLRRLLRELDRTLELDPAHVEAMATKGNLLLRLPRMLGGDPVEGERLLREVVRRDDKAVTSRIALAEACKTRGDRAEAVRLASRAREIAAQEGRADKVAEAQATLDDLGVSR